MLQETDLKPGECIRPQIKLEKCHELVSKLYGLKIIEIKELNGYDDKNFKIKIEKEFENFGDTFVLKILNNLDSLKLGFIEGQNELLLYLGNNGVKCPIPIKNCEGKYYSVEILSSGKHVVRLMVFLPGTILHEVPSSPELFYNVGKYVALLDDKLKKFHHPAYDTHSTVWMLPSLPKLRNFLFVIKDEKRRKWIEDTIDEFEKRVLKVANRFKEGIIHGDFNEQNILVGLEGDEWNVIGILDFGDTNKSCYLYELAITMTYMLIVGQDLDVGGYVLAGYKKIRDISELEFSVLKICIMARLCQSLVLGAYSSLQDPENNYILTTSGPGWKLFTKLISEPESTLLQRWKNIAETYQTIS